jgi:DNA-binding NarL/FixJ family response regulator
VDAVSPSPLIGRAREREAIADALERLRAGTGGIVAIEGEPGIGKSRLLAHLAESAATTGCTVLGARASEYEADLPYALWTDALDGDLAELGERRLSRLGLADPGALVATLPALAPLAGGAAAGDRHRTHRALRDLLERLAATRPLVLSLDDVHWADPASVDALAALAHRAPDARVLLALAAREGQLPATLAAGLSAALRDERATVLAPAPLSEAEAAELVGTAAKAIYPESGGNPFYLEQLARVTGSDGGGASTAADGSVPAPVAAALAIELAALGQEARRLLDAAAVAGDPFEPGLAAELAELSEGAALAALDELLERALVRPAGAPRRFTFRHPVVRHAVYAAIPGGRRLGAHARAGAALERRGAGAVERAHHVEHAAHPGDDHALGLLVTAARELQSPAPASAARYYAAALRLLPNQPEERSRRIEMQARLADAQAAAGDTLAARATLDEALRTAREGERLALTVGMANQEWWLGGHEDARRRLQVALAELPAQPSADRVRLRLALGLMALLACDLSEAQAQTSDARDDARAIGDPVFELAALAGGALACVAEADGSEGAERLDESAAALERLTVEQLTTRLPALWMHGRARRALGQFEASLADLERGAAIAAETGRERVLLILTVESVPTLIELGRLADACATGEEGVELARLAGNPRMLLWAHSALASALLAAGDAAALRSAREAGETGVRGDFHAAGQPGWCLGAALTAAGNPREAVAALRQAFGGPALDAILPADRPAAVVDLVEAQLACGDIAAAEEALAVGEVAAARAGTAWAAAVTAVARTEVLLARGTANEAVAAARAAREAAGGAPLLSARARLAEGRALAAAGERSAAIEALLDAESQLDGFGARRRRDEAVRELRRLGQRVLRPAREGSEGPLSPLTAREREIAELVIAGRTNREVAAQLVLSPRTIETHLHNIYGKLGVRSRVELVRAAEPSDPG